jgi:2-iminobutanoate/2-iminopropanoate deaminase
MAGRPNHPLKTRPPDARQHVTAGPYSPVLEVDARRLVVISGQVAADCTLADVFKVNIYLIDLGHWTRFNAVYEAVMPEPRPVRTAVQAVLLPGFLVEIEMWAVKVRD